MQPQNTQRKSLKVWIILLVGPFALLMIVAVMQLAVRLTVDRTGTDPCMTPQALRVDTTYLPCDVEPSQSPAKRIVNVVSILAGMAAVLGIMGSPMWLVFLIIAYEHNRKLDRQAIPPTMPPEA